ncbi:flagellar basal body P-ring protein FlgI [Buchnera aphidicola]|uniref:flagellar basal body P-ring protein FlgI n=1 Tax=Buchnera aphidicola TaxID=9 RepID=UPI0031B84B6B
MFALFFLKFILFFCLKVSSIVYADKIRDLTSVQGSHENQLIGYGLVVGLDGTGDQIMYSPLTLQTLNNMLSKFGIRPQSNTRIQPKNIASVIVTAELPNFSHQGEKIDVEVSSIGDAKSLTGGTLLMTPLTGIDNKIYAIAQGNILVSETKNHTFNNDNKKYIHHLNGVRINNGATIEREITSNFGKEKKINLQLNKADFSMSQRISDIININYPNSSIPLDARTIQVKAPNDSSQQVRMLSKIQNINVDLPEQEAKITINSNTGSIVINKDVSLDSCIIIDKNISLVINKSDIINKPNSCIIHTKVPQSIDKRKNHVPSITSQMQKTETNNINLDNIVRTLNSLGIKPIELISILQLMKNSGCLHAKLEIL